MRSIWLLAMGLLLCSAGAAGCIAEVRAERRLPEPETGQLTITWTIAGSNQPDECRSRRVSEMEVDVYDSQGRLETTTSAPCEDMKATVDLPDGDYTARARLVGRRGETASTTLPLDDIRVRADTELTIDVDFPAGSLR